MPLRTVPAPLAALLLLVALVALLLPGAPRAGADDGADVTWGVRTASGDLGADRQYFTYTADPGERVTDAVVVTNHDDEPVDLALYAADGFTTTSGQLDVVTRDAKSVGVGSWTSLATDRVTIEPGESLQVDLALEVPDDAEPGDYAGAVVTSLAAPAADEGVTVDRRLGIRVHLRVAGDLAPALAVEDLHVGYDGTLNPFAAGTATVTYTVRNTGNTRLSAGQDVAVAGPFGLATVAAADLADVPELLPGETWDVTTTVDGVRPLFRVGATTTLEPALPDAAEGAPALAAVGATAGTWAVPWTVLVLLLAAVGGVLLAVRRRRRRRQAEEQRVAAAVAQALRDRDAQDAGASV